jgi:putative intracellular protease/amidase
MVIRKILIVLSEYRYRVEELVGPLQVFERAGYDVDFATPKGKKPHALHSSYDLDFIDPPLNKKVVGTQMAKSVFELENSNRLDKPLSLEELLPDYPYLSSVNYLR